MKRLQTCSLSLLACSLALLTACGDANPEAQRATPKTAGLQDQHTYDIKAKTHDADQLLGIGDDISLDNREGLYPNTEGAAQSPHQAPGTPMTPGAPQTAHQAGIRSHGNNGGPRVQALDGAPLIQHAASDATLRQQLIDQYQVPKEWGENVTGVQSRLATDEKVIALTLDACGGPNGSAYDAELIYFLRQQQIPATLFVNSRWIDANYWTFIALSKIPLFEIENHGTAHRPLSINGRDAWGIRGTQNVGEIVDEVLNNHRKIESLTGRAPKFFRAGTAYYDEVGVQVANELGEQVAGYNLLGDAGATFTTDQVYNAMINAKPGSIALLHFNHPDKWTSEGLKKAIPELKRRGFRFVKLEDMPLQ